MRPSWNTRLNVERLNQGRPLIAPDPDAWDNRFTLNPTAVHLPRSAHNDRIIRGMLGHGALADPRLAGGIVAIFYRGIPEPEPGLPTIRSYVGLAVFTPELKLLKRFDSPVIAPSDNPTDCDFNGVEDQRITRIGDTFYIVYCGFNPRLARRHTVRLCMATSTDLVNWTKLGPISGSVNDVPNKDAVLLSEPVDGNYLMLHRPCVGGQGNMSISLAISDSPTGSWRDLGTIMRPLRHRSYRTSWVGAGSTPISLGNKRFLSDYHTGNFCRSGGKEYFASYAILNLNGFDIERPESIIESRCERVLAPQTPYEVNSPWPHSENLNCVFPCGSYEYGSDIILVYGGADSYVLAARFDRNELLFELEALSCLWRPDAEALPFQIKDWVARRHPGGSRRPSRTIASAVETAG